MNEQTKKRLFSGQKYTFSKKRKIFFFLKSFHVILKLIGSIQLHSSKTG